MISRALPLNLNQLLKFEEGLTSGLKKQILSFTFKTKTKRPHVNDLVNTWKFLEKKIVLNGKECWFTQLKPFTFHELLKLFG